MTFLATQPTEERQQLQVLAQTPSDPDGFKPGFFAGSGTAAATGLGRVVGVANQLAGEAEYQTGALFTRPLDELFDTKLTGFLDEQLRQGPAQLTASMTPDPYTTGTLGQILYSLVGVGVPAAVGTYFGGPVGGAALAGTFQAGGTYTDLTVTHGVDPTTATGAALFEGALTGVGVGMPMSIGGKVALNTLLYGPGINVAQDLIAQQGTAALLEARGYDQLADRYAELDAELLAADVILGAAFGYAGSRAAARPAPAQPLLGTDQAPSQAPGTDIRAPAPSDVQRFEPLAVPLARVTATEVAGLIDERIAALEKASGARLPDDEHRALLAEFNDIDQLLREQYAARASGLRLSPENALTAAELRDAEARRLEARSALEASRAGQTAEKSLARLRGRLDKIDTDADLIALARAFMPPDPVNQHAIDAAHAALDQRHIELDTAPGIPTDYAALQSHTRALNAATEALLDGRPVEVNAERGTFVDKPANPAYSDDALLAALHQSGLPGLLDDITGLEAELARRGRAVAEEPLPAVPAAIPRDPSLSEHDAAIEGRFADAIAADVDGAIRRYSELPETEGGKVLNTDLGRELDPSYRADRTRSAAVHEPASWLVKEMYRRKLREAPAPGERALVLFTGGGTGAGKSSALESIPAMSLDKATAQIVYDTNLNDFRSSVAKIDQALAAGKEVRIAFVLRDPVEALVKGALPRAESKGRTVPLAKHAETHVGAAETLPKLAEHYAGDKRVRIAVIDNTHGKGRAKLADVALAATFDYSDIAKRLRAALDQEYERGSISEAVYRGTAGVDAARAGLRRAADAAGGRAEKAAARNGSSGLQRDHGRANGAQSQRQDGRETGLSDVAAEVVADTPELTVVDDTGETVPAAALLADADRAIGQAEQDAPGFLAAVNCFLRSGA